MSERITQDEVRHVAKLARLALPEDKVAPLTGELDAVLDYVAKLNELDVSDVEPMAHAMDVTDALREDQPKDGLSNEAALDNAPDADPPFFKVPKVLGEGPSA